MDIPKLTVNLKCGEDNDYDSVLEVAKEEGMEKMKGAVQDQLEKDFKGLFKKS